MKRVLWLVAALLCLAMGLAAAEETAEFIYTDNGDGTCTITSYQGAGGDVVIPEELGGLAVAAIGDGTFGGCETMTSLTIPASVRDISFTEETFAGCTALERFIVATDNPVYFAVDGALMGFVVLEGVPALLLWKAPAKVSDHYTVPEGALWIFPGAFQLCKDMTSVTIPNSVVVATGAFMGCDHLAEIIVAEDHPFFKVADGALMNKAGSELYAVPAARTGAFAIPEGIERIGPYAFYGCAGLTSVAISEGVTSIADNAFDGCEQIVLRVAPGSYAENWAAENGVPYTAE